MDWRTILIQSQAELKETLHQELVALGYEPLCREGYLYAAGTVPVLLVAHLDTYFQSAAAEMHKRQRSHDDTETKFHALDLRTGEQEKILCVSEDGRYWMSPDGLGGDDRSGVYMALCILAEERCHILFCEDEEIGRLGAQRFCADSIHPRINYIIGLDRQGANDAVFYHCVNPEFIAFVCGQGWSKERGSVSDISEIAPVLGVAAVNLSVGYFDEHHRYEVADMQVIKQNIERILRMVRCPTGRFEYIDESEVAALTLDEIGEIF